MMLTNGEPMSVQVTYASEDRSLQTNALLVSLLALLVFAVFLLYESHRLIQITDEESIRQGDFLFSTSSLQIADALYFNDIERIRENSENIVAQDNVAAYAVFAPDGRYLTDTRQSGIPSGYIAAELIELALTTDDALFKLSAEHIDFVGAIRIEGEILGGIYFRISLLDQLAANETSLRETAINGLFLIVSITLISFGLVYLKGTTQSLRQAESNFRNLIEQSPLPCSIYSPDGTLNYANAAMQQLMGNSDHTRAMTRPGYNIYRDITLNHLGISGQIREAYKSGGTDIPVFEYRSEEQRDSETEHPWLKVTVFPLRSANGSSGQMVIIFQDMTAERRAEEERTELNEYLLQSQKLEGLGSMARGIAHDFNNLLTPVLGNADVLQNSLVLNDEQNRRLESIKTAAMRASELCDQMLTYGGEGEKDWQAINLSNEISSLSELMRSSVSRKIIFKEEFSADLPLVMADQSQLRSVILNLLTNASEALDDRQGEVRLVTGTRSLTTAESHRLLPDPNLPAGDYVYIEVSDTGIGMSEEVKARLFDPFFTTKFTGRGLGMSSVLGIIGDHHGGIAVKSRPGMGSTFTIYLPVAAA